MKPCSFESSDSRPIPRKKAGPGRLKLQDKPHEERGNEIWLVTLSDLLMLLMIFFVVLFGMALEREKKAQEYPQAGIAAAAVSKETGNFDHTRVAPNPNSPRTNDPAILETDLIAALNYEKGEKDVLIERIADHVILTFPESILFDSGQAQLKSSAGTILDNVANFINERPYLVVEVQGHTDNTPISNSHYPSNWELSVDRAMQVSKALIGLGVNPTLLSVKGFGEYRPRLPNDSDASRLQNRRVEIQFSVPPQT